MQAFGVAVFDKTPLIERIAQDQKNKNVKEQELWNLFDAKTQRISTIKNLFKLLSRRNLVPSMGVDS